MTLLADARHALRLLGRSPLFAATAVLSLSLGVAASSTVYSVADALRRRRPGCATPGASSTSAAATTAAASTTCRTRPSSTCASTPRRSTAWPRVEFGGRPMSLTRRRVERAGLRHAGLGQLLRRPGHAGGPRPVLPARRRRRARRAAGRRAHPPLLDPPPRRRSRRARPAAAPQQPRVRSGRGRRARLRRRDAGGHRPLRADGDGGRGPRPGHRRPAHRRPRRLAPRRGAAAARRLAGRGGGGARTR